MEKKAKKTRESVFDILRFHHQVYTFLPIPIVIFTPLSPFGSPFVLNLELMCLLQHIAVVNLDESLEIA